MAALVEGRHFWFESVKYLLKQLQSLDSSLRAYNIFATEFRNIVR